MKRGQIMGRAKTAIIVVVCTVFLLGFSVHAGAEERKGKPQTYEYTGIIKAKGDESHILKVETQSGTMNFHYKRNGKKQCAGYKELAIGDRIKVTASDNKPVPEATCIMKALPNAMPTK
jgi:hypothetical protein